MESRRDRPGELPELLFENHASGSVQGKQSANRNGQEFENPVRCVSPIGKNNLQLMERLEDRGLAGRVTSHSAIRRGPPTFELSSLRVQR